MRDLLGGGAAVLVALPAAIAFGLVIYAPLGSGYSSTAAIAGITGTIALGLVAPLFGGTSKLVSAPCAPGAAVLAVFVAELVANGSIQPSLIPLYVVLVTLIAGFLQFMAGCLGGGKVIKYVPYPVVAGYLNGVGLLIFLGQLPKFIGIPKTVKLWEGITSPSLWQWPAIYVGLVAIIAMLVTPKLTKSIPAAIVAIVTSIAAYFSIAVLRPDLATLEGNPFVIGSISSSITDIVHSAVQSWSQIGLIPLSDLRLIIVPAITLAVLLSVDTLKTSVLLDALTYTRHNSNKELAAQGLANMTSAIACGIPGSGTAGPSLVNLTSGGRTRLSGLFAGIFALAILLLLGQFVAWIPLASLAGILLVVAVRMLDRTNFKLLKHKSTVLDFFVILAVVVSAVSMSLLEAAGVGVAMAIMLFLREQVRASVVHRKAFGYQTFSKKRRLPSELSILETEGSKTVIFELQGQLFFGTADQLLTEMEPHLSHCQYVVLDMRRVQSVDFTAANILRQVHTRIKSNGGYLLFSSIPLSLPSGQNVKDYLESLGLTESPEDIRFFPEIDDALEWVEDTILFNAHTDGRGHATTLDLSEINFFAGLSEQAFTDLRSCLKERTFQPGETIFQAGDPSDEMFFMRKGTVKVFLPLPNGKTHHIATFVRADFFGEMSFLDKSKRSATAIAATRVETYVLSRQAFDELTIHHSVTTRKFFERLSYAMAMRLRQTNAELTALEQD
ncbi:MAG TPA: SLC26A/SulP transporter family protein [Candidatus Hydrogenedentes bacterium]|nr:SLC26A/SulP transporter family protein [Candidatus Hydrogenedentota bacterium]